MRRRRLVSILLTFCLIGRSPQPASCGDRGGMEHVEAESYVPRLPVLPRDARTWITLHETRMKPLPDGTPLVAVIRAIKQASRGEGGTRPPLEILTDPISLQENEITLETPVDLPAFGLEDVSLETYLSFVTRPFRLLHRVQSGVVVIEYPPGDRPRYQSATAAEARTWLLLHEVIPLNFAEETPVRDVLAAISRATAGKGNDGRGLAIYVNIRILKGEKKLLDSMVRIELERVPLCTSLALVLRQAGLAFYVRDDGIVCIVDRGMRYELYMDEFGVFDGLRVNSWAEYLEMQYEECSREAEKAPESKAPGRPSREGGFRSPVPPDRARTPRGHR